MSHVAIHMWRLSTGRFHRAISVLAAAIGVVLSTERGVRSQMARKGKRKKGARRGPPPEDRRAEATTVIWMLCVLATVLSQSIAFLVQFGLSFATDPEQIPATIWALPGLMLFTAFLTGALTLLLIPLVYRFRQTPPPRPITIFAIFVSILPLAVLLGVTIRSTF